MRKNLAHCIVFGMAMAPPANARRFAWARQARGMVGMEIAPRTFAARTSSIATRTLTLAELLLGKCVNLVSFARRRPRLQCRRHRRLSHAPLPGRSQFAKHLIASGTLATPNAKVSVWARKTRMLFIFVPKLCRATHIVVPFSVMAGSMQRKSVIHAVNADRHTL